jgi:cytosine/adenosine deaminase-related metal-dependent hydrolase/ubiquinone/menaquinone biosynthesis C-methylase UbiE
MTTAPQAGIVPAVASEIGPGFSLEIPEHEMDRAFAPGTGPQEPCGQTLFDLWAEVYDTQPNPLLQLEERTLDALLPSIQGADIFDVGCGTGRWLARLEANAPRSLAGSDPSPAMLERARAKLSATTQLHQTGSTRLPSHDASLDLILASFVLGYIDDLPAFARESARVLRPGGTLLLSDMHPRTAAERGWTRSFSAGNETVHLPAHARPLREIATVFSQHGLTVTALEEQSFGEPERSIFERNNKPDAYAGLTGVPAIYLLKLSKPDEAAPLHRTLNPNGWANSPSAWSKDPLSIAYGRIASEPHSESLDLTGYVLLPGLINAHDHLEFALFPNLGRAPDDARYRNASEWANEIHQVHAETIRKHLSVPLGTRLWFGALRNLLCGVTTVCHHNPLHPELLAPEFPLRVVTNFAWAHSLNFGQNPAEARRDAPSGTPFILHAAEGTDRESRAELAELERRGLLDHRTVLVHGLALITRDIALLNERGAATIFCPTSNRFLFGRIPPPHIVRQLARAALGSDSPLTAAGDLLDEVQLLREQKIDPVTLYNLVTANPAQILGLEEGEGGLRQGGRADVIAVRETGLTPAETLARLALEDIELVAVGGRVQVASPALYKRLPSHHRPGMHLLQIGDTERWVRAPLPVLFASADAILGRGNLRIGNKEVRHLATD